jgi:hypothetical protein
VDQLNVIQQEAIAWFDRVSAYVSTLPLTALIALALPCLVSLAVRSAGAFVITVLLAVVAVSIPHAGPSERYQYGTLVLLVVSGFVAAMLGSVRRPRKVDYQATALTAELERAIQRINELELRLQREKVWQANAKK